MNHTGSLAPIAGKRQPRLVLIEHLKHYCFQFYSASGEKLLTSDSFASAVACAQAMMELKSLPPGPNEYEKKRTVTGQFCYILKAKNGEKLGASEWHWSEASCDFAWKTLIWEISQADIMEE